MIVVACRQVIDVGSRLGSYHQRLAVSSISFCNGGWVVGTYSTRRHQVMKRALTNLKRTVAVLVICCLMFSLIPANTFAVAASDISGHWAQVKIQSWMDKGLIKGYPDGTFKPDQDVTRAEFMALANRAFSFTAKATINYTDVQADAWYTNAIAIAKAAGYISGYPENTMKPENPITREEVATIVARIKNLTSAANAADKYTDAAKIGSWSKGQVGAVTSAQIMQGYPDGSFMPQGLMTRAEVVVASDNALHYTAPVANIAVRAITVTPTTMALTAGGATGAITATVGPSNATNKIVTWSSSNAAVATVAGGVVTPVAAGAAVITATAVQGSFTATCTVTVTAPVVSGAPAPTTYTVTFDSQGGTAVTAITGIASGATVTLPTAPTKTGYTFNGWFTAATGGTAFAASTAVTANVPVYAQWTAAASTAILDATSGVFTTAHGDYTVTVTLTGGTFAAGPFTAADFTFAGTNNAVLAAATTFTRTSATVVTITGLGTLTGGADNTVLVKAATQATQATSVAGTASSPFTYTTSSDNKITITGYTGTDTVITIPSMLDGNYVTIVGDRQVGTQQVGAFQGYSRMTSVTIPDSVTGISKMAFYGCSGLTSVAIPSSVTSIVDEAFYNCTGLTEILVNVNNSNYASVDGVLYNKGITVLIQCPGGNTRTSFTIPNSVTTIGLTAFCDCTRLTSVSIPNSVTSIGASAFVFCTALTSVSIPNSVTSIGYGAFSNCTSLTSVTIGSGVTSIGASAFVFCPALTSVIMGRAGTTIGDILMNNNNFRTAYISGGVGTYAGTYTGAWTRLSSDASLTGGTLGGVELSGTFTGTVDIGSSSGSSVIVPIGSLALVLGKGNNSSTIKYVLKTDGSQPVDAGSYGSTYSGATTIHITSSADRIWLMVTAQDGTTIRYCWITVTVAPTPLAAIGAITGTPQAGEVLTAGALTPTGATATATYQWRISATSGGTYADISGATATTYTLAAGDVTKFIEVVATGTGSYSGSVTSAPTAVVVATDLLAAGVTGFVAPVKGAVPIGLGVLNANAATYIKTSLVWAPTDNPYLGNIVYTATVVLTAASGYKFPIGGLTPTVNTGTPALGTVSGGDVAGNTLTFTVTFPVTAYFVIGESYGGGKVAYIDGTGQHGLIAATGDQSIGIRWYNGSFIQINAFAAALGTGMANTNAIISVQGATATSYAAGLARACTDGSNNDWYLPSEDELAQLYSNRVAIGGFNTGSGVAYWSSTETSSAQAWAQHFDNGQGGNYSKDSTYYVRAVRTF
jgi:uncharacterized repeat protein (TIGR02543 family)